MQWDTLLYLLCNGKEALSKGRTCKFSNLNSIDQKFMGPLFSLHQNICSRDKDYPLSSSLSPSLPPFLLPILSLLFSVLLHFPVSVSLEIYCMRFFIPLHTFLFPLLPMCGSLLSLCFLSIIRFNSCFFPPHSIIKKHTSVFLVVFFVSTLC